MSDINWDDGFVRISGQFHTEDVIELRKKVEPWLSAIFQGEHLSLLIGNGLTIGVNEIANANSPQLDRVSFENQYAQQIRDAAQREAELTGRGIPNFEDDLRAAINLKQGLEIINAEQAEELETEINAKLGDLLRDIARSESNFVNTQNFEGKAEALILLRSFLMSFASRAASRDRLHIFTTNYDRFIEFGCDNAAILTIDRFIGNLDPQLRTTRLELDYHYNPPGIRGEPRYVEGVVRLTKLHGSLDWRFSDALIRRVALPFGSNEAQFQNLFDNALEHVVIYPNPAKDIETAFYPYSELFRDFGFATSRPNSVLVTYGYSFGDSHINRMIEDMLTTPSTHLVVIAYADPTGKIKNFIDSHSSAQITVILGARYASLRHLVNHLLPKPAIDPITERQRRLLERRGEISSEGGGDIENE